MNYHFHNFPAIMNEPGGAVAPAPHTSQPFQPTGEDGSMKRLILSASTLKRLLCCKAGCCGMVQLLPGKRISQK